MPGAGYPIVIDAGSILLLGAVCFLAGAGCLALLRLLVRLVRDARH